MTSPYISRAIERALRAAVREFPAVVLTGTRLIPIEIKATSTPRPALAAGIQRFQADLPRKAAAGFVVHLGTQSLPLAPGVTALPFRDL